ncbi:MAG: arsenic efflux protein [Clostridia bacterium]|nr:arsenic efflux protein [Clostridia bacterium]
MFTWDFVWDILWDALLDTLKLLPFLFLAYLLMEASEHRFSEKMEARLRRMGKLGPLVGAALGCVPQCGFSSAAANFYAAGLISRGTLLAVFLSTSDEALPLMITSPGGWRMIPPLLLSKVAVGIAAGFAVDLILKKRGAKRELYDLCENCGCEEEGGILRPALWHTGHILLFIFCINLLLNGAIEFLGQERIASILLHGSALQPFAAALVGLIPNCAASVTLTQLYLAGSLSFSACLAGLCSNAGIGLAVLLRMNKSKRENFQIIVTLYLVSALFGLALQLLL